MELQVILELYEVVIIPGILFNCEAWTLTGSDIESLESMQIWAIKRLLDLPRTTPTTSILYSLKIPYVETRIIIRQLNFMHKILIQETMMTGLRG